jgi:ParB family chromosome partitioning protein
MSTFRVTPGQQLARISARHDGRELEAFDPHRFRYNQLAFDVIIKEAKQRIKEVFREYGLEEAKKIKEWPMLLPAAAEKLAEQQLFVAWWKASIRSQGEARKEVQDRGLLSVPEAENLTGMTKQRVSALAIRLRDDEEGYLRHLVGAEYFAAFLEMPLPRGAQGSGENEWFTPQEYIELARLVLGSIDLDPATSAQAQKLIRAEKFYTEKTDGLKRQWHGRVWLNPPFAQPLIEQFVLKMVEEYAAKRATAAIMLTHNYTDTTWFHEAAKAAAAICFTRGRVKFYKPDGTIASPTQGQAFFYFGDDVPLFVGTFKKVGFIGLPMRLSDVAA